MTAALRSRQCPNAAGQADVCPLLGLLPPSQKSHLHSLHIGICLHSTEVVVMTAQANTRAMGDAETSCCIQYCESCWVFGQPRQHNTGSLTMLCTQPLTSGPSLKPSQAALDPSSQTQKLVAQRARNSLLNWFQSTLRITASRG